MSSEPEGDREKGMEDNMRKLNKTLTCTMLAAAMAAGTLTGCSSALDGTKIVATVGDEEVTLGLASYVTRDQQAQMMSYYAMLMSSYGVEGSGMSIWDEVGEDGKSVGDSSKDDAMNTINELYVMKAHAADYDVTISEEEEAAIKEAAAAFIEANDAETLKELAVSEADIITYLELVTYRQKMEEPMVADVDQEVSDDVANQTRVNIVKVSTKGTETDEDGNTIELTDEEKAEKKELAQKVLDKLKASENPAEADMEALAKEVDESLTYTKPLFTTAGNEEDTLDQAVQEAALKLKDGEVADEVVEGEDAYYVVRLESMFDEEATESKISLIISERKNDLHDEILEGWVEADKIKVNESVWKKLKVKDSVVFQYKVSETTEESAE